MAFAPPRPWTWEQHELSEGYSCIVYDADGRKVELDHIDAETAAVVASAFELRAALRSLTEAADSVKLRLCDDAEEYTDHEKHRALNNLYDEIGAAQAALANARGTP
jgi:hypothetical protein